MSGENKKEIAFEIAHVLFIDIVGYSKLLINEQRELLEELNHVVRGTEQFQRGGGGGEIDSSFRVGTAWRWFFPRHRKRQWNARWKSVVH